MRTYSSQSAASFASHASASRQPSAEILEEDESSASNSPSQRKRQATTAMTDSDAAASPRRSRVASSSDAGSVYNADMSASMLSVVDPAGLDEIENSVRQSKTIEDFTSIISEFRMNRQTLYSDSLAGSLAQDPADTISASASHHSIGQRSESAETVRCTCCCSKDDCPRALRARQEWRDLEADLRLSAEIGQALLRRHDAMQAKLQKQAEEYMQQRDGLMTRLTKSYKETSALERELAQSNLNLEAGDSSNRALLHELDDARSQLTKLKASQTRLSGADERARYLERELEDLKQELAAERKRSQAAEARSKKLEIRSTQLKEALNNARHEANVETRPASRALFDDSAIQAARDRLTLGLRHERTPSLFTNASFASDDAEQVQAIEALVRDNEALRSDNDKLRSLVDTCNAELDTLRSSVTDAITIVASPALDLARFDEQPSSYLEAKATATLSMEADSSIGIHSVDTEPKQELQRANLGDATEGWSASSRPPIPAYASSTGSFIFPPTSPTAAKPSDGHSSSVTRSESLAYTADSSAASQPPDSISFAPSSRSSATSRDTEKQTPDFLHSDPARRESRTAQLGNLLENVNRLFNRLSTADVDTLTRRLQRQNLAGDAGHLAKTTVHSILRDVDGLREHFRKLIETEARNHARDDNSAHSKDFAGESLVARKEFFALLKTFRDILCELAKLRLCINDIHLNPAQAAKLLNEHLGANTAEDRSLIPIPSAVNWLGKMLLGGPSGTPTTPSPSSSSPSASLAVPDAAGMTGTKGGRPVARRTISGNYAGHLAPRASPAVVSSTLAVEVKGTHASAAEATQQRLSISPQTPLGGGLRTGPRPQRGRSQASLTRVQSRNLSGLFAGSLTPSYAVFDAARSGQSDLSSSLAQTSSLRPRLEASKTTKPWQRPLSRIVDDDEISIHRGRAIRQQVFDDSGDEGSDDEMKGSGNLLERTLRPRGLSDSSVRSVFVDMADGIGGMPVSPAANRIRPSPISRIITPATLSLHSTPSAPAVVSAASADDDRRSADGNASPSISSERSGNLTPGAVGIAGGVASSIFSRSEKVLSFLSGGVVGSGASIQPSNAATGHSGGTLRQTPSIAALNKAAARGAPSPDLSVSPRNAAASQSATSASADTRAQTGLGVGLPQRSVLGGAGSSRSGF
ncbi:hypothetical protein EX895_002977 [Sporisorium graminicola]|uniref:Uncharacterized protein n=1 Tax=Sporisorium graminicola TaxID=280036 RepID=A0A4U7KVT6_9BASI|nr:hypothetical protein EX895_002977 [Sporisorium graminicola]TKY88267.1 hypothetical protein EX895_002977 [Sporisorium graminicola]